jgi:hypothetical protein
LIGAIDIATKGREITRFGLPSGISAVLCAEASVVDLKFLLLWPQARIGTSNLKPH